MVASHNLLVRGRARIWVCFNPKPGLVHTAQSKSWRCSRDLVGFLGNLVTGYRDGKTEGKGWQMAGQRQVRGHSWGRRQRDLEQPPPPGLLW